MTSTAVDARRISSEICSLRDFATCLPYNRRLELFLGDLFDSTASASLVPPAALSAAMKQISGKILSGQLKNCVSADRGGMDRAELAGFYRSILNQQSNQSQVLTFLFFKVLYNNLFTDPFQHPDYGFPLSELQGGGQDPRSHRRQVLRALLGGEPARRGHRHGRTGHGNGVVHNKVGDSTNKSSAMLTTTIFFIFSRIERHRRSIQPHLSFEDFLDYLFSPMNDIVDPTVDSVHQDMSQPLSHYFINSSHNTYLTGSLSEAILRKFHT